ncbi:MAG: SpoIID/LytB domain-containing protein [Hungatella sp.]|nr:SpoIID/LytB domain-containing protein [Hungatella sp.]
MRRFWLVCLIAVLFPYVVTLSLGTAMTGTGGRGQGSAAGRKIYLDRQRGGYVDVEEYLVGVVAKQIPGSYEEEAIKAQAVIARTYVYRQMDGREEVPESELDLEYLEEEQMEKLWGKPRFLEYYQKIRRAVEETGGEVLKAEGEYIEPLFHRASAGQTRDGDPAHPYLAGVDAREDMEAEDYLTVVLWTPEELTGLVRRIPGGDRVSVDQIPSSIQVIARDSAGYVTEIQFGSHSFDGESVRSALGLPSAAYTLEACEGGVRAVCRGQGHGYGLSQYGAHKKAALGMTAEEILAYYYTGVTIEDEIS